MVLTKGIIVEVALSLHPGEIFKSDPGGVLAVRRISRFSRAQNFLFKNDMRVYAKNYERLPHPADNATNGVAEAFGRRRTQS